MGYKYAVLNVEIRMYHIGFNSNQAYFPYIAVVINSIVNIYIYNSKTDNFFDEINRQKENFIFHIFTDYASQEYLLKFKQLEQKLSKIIPVQIIFHVVDKYIFSEYVMWRGNHVAYYKVLLNRYLTADVKRILFIDGDTLVVKDIRELLCMDMHGKSIAAVSEHQIYTLSSRTGKKSYSFADCKTYFNAGVLLIDMEKWRLKNAEEKCIAFLNEYNVICPEQDALSAVFRDDVYLLPFKWNMKLAKSLHPRDYGSIAKNFAMISDEQEKWFWEGIKHPAIIHYSVRPWAGDGYYLSKKDKEFYEYPNLDLWWEIAEKTPVFNIELLAIKKSFAYKKQSAKNAVLKFLVQYPFVVKLLKMNDKFQWIIRKIEKPFKMVRNKIRIWKAKAEQK